MSSSWTHTPTMLKSVLTGHIEFARVESSRWIAIGALLQGSLPFVSMSKRLRSFAGEYSEILRTVDKIPLELHVVDCPNCEAETRRPVFVCSMGILHTGMKQDI